MFGARVWADTLPTETIANRIVRTMQRFMAETMGDGQSGKHDIMTGIVKQFRRPDRAMDLQRFLRSGVFPWVTP